jgi:hypothetical protein
MLSCSLEVHVSHACRGCHHRGGQCGPEKMGNFFCHIAVKGIESTDKENQIIFWYNSLLKLTPFLFVSSVAENKKIKLLIGLCKMPLQS